MLVTYLYVKKALFNFIETQSPSTLIGITVILSPILLTICLGIACQSPKPMILILGIDTSVNANNCQLHINYFSAASCPTTKAT
jgi:hypothetical protein